MYPTTYGRGKLAFYNDLSEKALERLSEVLSGMVTDRQDATFDKRARTLVEEAIRRKFVRMQSVFPDLSLSEQFGESPNPMAARERICQITACWIDSVRSLADDNELDVQRSNGNGSVGAVSEIVAESILDDAVLAGRLVEIRRL